jgi:hypothetical protein
LALDELTPAATFFSVQRPGEGGQKHIHYLEKKD